MIKNEEKYGKKYCPCRKIHRDEIVCPCVYHKEEIKKQGHCHCFLFVSKDEENGTPKWFLRQKNIFAIIGVSKNPDKWGFKIFNELKSKGFMVFPVNPKYDKIKDDICYLNLTSLPQKPNVVITIVLPEITFKIVKECKDLKIEKIWMQPGSESEKAIKFCKNNNIKIVANACFVMDDLNKNFGG